VLVHTTQVNSEMQFHFHAEASSSSSFQSGGQLVYRAGQSIVQGLLAALLAVSALARVHKVCSIIVEMTGLSYPGGQTPDSCIAGWLHTSIQHLPPGELCACQACIHGIGLTQPICISIINVHSKCKRLCLCCRAYGGSGASQICI